MANQKNQTETELLFQKPQEQYSDSLSSLIKKPLGKQQVSNEQGPFSNNRQRKVQGIVVGTITQVQNETFPCILVDFPGNQARAPLSAISTQKINPDDIGREVALAFQDGDLALPIILGFIEKLVPTALHGVSTPDAKHEQPVTAVKSKNGSQVMLSAEDEIVLKCGKSSMTLTRSGKILLRGKYISSRSSGVNRIKGGSVQIN